MFSFEGTSDLQKNEKSRDNSEEVTPVPIPNTVVKLFIADNTWLEATWEGRKPRAYFLRPHGQEVKTSPFHGGNMSSILIGVTIKGLHNSAALFITDLAQFADPMKTARLASLYICGCGGIGRHARFRFLCDERAGSSPVSRTKMKRGLSLFFIIYCFEYDSFQGYSCGYPFHKYRNIRKCVLQLVNLFLQYRR